MALTRPAPAAAAAVLFALVLAASPAAAWRRGDGAAERGTARPPSGRPNTPPPRSCANTLVMSGIDGSGSWFNFGLSQDGQSLAWTYSDPAASAPLKTAFAVGGGTCSYQPEDVTTPTAAEINAILAGDGNNDPLFAYGPVAPVNDGANRFLGVAYNKQGVSGYEAKYNDGQTTFNKTSVLASVFEFRRYSGSPVVGRWVVRGNLPVSMVISNNDTSSQYRMKFFPKISMSANGNVAVVHGAAERCIVPNGRRRRNLLEPIGDPTCGRVTSPGGGFMSVFEWDRRTKAYVETLTLPNVFNIVLTNTSTPYSVNPYGDALFATVSADGKVVAVNNAYGSVQMWQKTRRSGWQVRGTYNITSLIPAQPIGTGYILGLGLSRGGDWLVVQGVDSLSLGYAGIFAYDKNTAAYTLRCFQPYAGQINFQGYATYQQPLFGTTGFGETPFNRLRTAAIASPPINPTAPAMVQLFDFSISDLRKMECKPLGLYNATVPSFGDNAVQSNMLALSGNGVNLIVTDFNTTRAYASTFPKRSWVPGAPGH